MKQQDLKSHAAYIAKLTQSGSVFAGGGFADRDGGLAIVRAADWAEAEAMLKADPAIVNGVFVAEAHEWSPRFHTSDPLIQQPK